MGYNKDTLISWYKSPEGAGVAALETKIITPVVDHFRPYRCLELAHHPLVSSSQVKEKINVSCRFNKQISESSTCVVSDLGQLPFVSDYFDLIICCHAHEMCDHSGKVISELSRVLMADGLIVFVSFNPYGWWLKRDFANMQSWWQHPLSRNDLLSLTNLCSLTEVYTDYAGFLWVQDQPKKTISGMASSSLAQHYPEAGILFKTVVRKQVSAAVGPVCTSGLHNVATG